MFAPSREESRRFVAGAWAKYRAAQPLSALEQRMVAIIAMHPEYHDLVDAVEHHVERDYPPEGGAMNPFLHLSLHLAIAEQLAIDQPHGLRAHYERLRTSRSDEHAALHALIECLGEVMWQAQRTSTPPDEALYLDCLRRQK